MPTIEESQINMDGLPVRAPTLASNLRPVTKDNEGTQNPYMLASMPAIASSSDGLQRQFRRGSTVPTQRIFPVMQRQK